MGFLLWTERSLVTVRLFFLMKIMLPIRLLDYELSDYRAVGLAAIGSHWDGTSLDIWFEDSFIRDSYNSNPHFFDLMLAGRVRAHIILKTWNSPVPAGTGRFLNIYIINNRVHFFDIVGYQTRLHTLQQASVDCRQCQRNRQNADPANYWRLDTVIYDVKGKKTSSTSWYHGNSCFQYNVRSDSPPPTSNHKSGG